MRAGAETCRAWKSGSYRITARFNSKNTEAQSRPPGSTYFSADPTMPNNLLSLRLPGTRESRPAWSDPLRSKCFLGGGFELRIEASGNTIRAALPSAARLCSSPHLPAERGQDGVYDMFV
ncbi:hypothetical protein NDU88_007884 [Pleurodeles waltl]|uniref:Uncharacterized protein n=1 Tax=Pleurodeles waltl TaxID=8319 RepID=A0AAV7NBH2_PLEWA|nr:hypothetical protein NDU88_007884 [Pleurodeles waltl]